MNDRTKAGDPAPYYQAHVFCCVNERPAGHKRGCCKSRGAEPLRNYMKARAKELILTARRIRAEEALRIGLFNQVVESSRLRAAALELAEEIARNGPVAVRAAKEAIDRGTEMPLAQALEVEAECYARTLSTQDRLEALAAFAEKRKPNYLGR